MLALDLFAGTGWGVACQRLGIEELGVELMPAAIATRDAAGMSTIYTDVWTGLPHDVANADPWGYDVLIASPPCQTFSRAGKGAGHRALDEVTALIDSGAYLHPDALRAFGDRHDPRTALVVTPLAYVARDLPRFVVLEQVPAVLPVWEAMAVQLRANGYSAWTGVLNAEQYGVPQTRKRAILIARADGTPAGPPTPTHSRYYPRDPQRMDDHGVLPWVSMADALGWGMTDRPYLTIASSRTTGGPDKEKVGGSQARAVIYGEQAAGRWVAEKPMGAGMVERHGDRRPRGVEEPAFTLRTGVGGGHASPGFHWSQVRPSTTIVGTFRPDIIAAPGWRKLGDGPRQNTEGSVRVTLEEAAALQSYPADFPFQGSKTHRFLQVGNAVPPLLAEAILAGLR